MEIRSDGVCLHLSRLVYKLVVELVNGRQEWVLADGTQQLKPKPLRGSAQFGR